MYTLSAAGWHKVPPVIQAIATFGLDLLEPDDSALTPLNGFLAGILLGFHVPGAGDLTASYRVDIDGRRFEFGVHRGGLTAAQGTPIDEETKGHGCNTATLKFCESLPWSRLEHCLAAPDHACRP